MHLPYTVNGILGSLCALGVLLLHDTYSKDLQDKMDDDDEEGGNAVHQFDEKKGLVFISLLLIFFSKVQISNSGTLGFN